MKPKETKWKIIIFQVIPRKSVACEQVEILISKQAKSFHPLIFWMKKRGENEHCEWLICIHVIVNTVIAVTAHHQWHTDWLTPMSSPLLFGRFCQVMQHGVERGKVTVLPKQLHRLLHHQPTAAILFINRSTFSYLHAWCTVITKTPSNIRLPLFPNFQKRHHNKWDFFRNHTARRQSFTATVIFFLQKNNTADQRSASFLLPKNTLILRQWFENNYLKKPPMHLLFLKSDYPPCCTILLSISHKESKKLSGHSTSEHVKLLRKSREWPKTGALLLSLPYQPTSKCANLSVATICS